MKDIENYNIGVRGGGVFEERWKGGGSKPELMMISRNAVRSAGNHYLWNQ